MSVRKLNAPKKSSTRTPKWTFTDKEVSDAIKALEGGDTPGVGPHQHEVQVKAERSARNEVNALKAAVLEASEYASEDLGTRAWTDDEGSFAVLRVR